MKELYTIGQLANLIRERVFELEELGTEAVVEMFMRNFAQDMGPVETLSYDEESDTYVLTTTD